MGIHRPSHLPRNGRARPARRDDSGTIWWCRPQLCFVRIDRARSRTRRLRLSLDDVGAIVAGDAADSRVRQRSAKAAIDRKSTRLNPVTNANLVCRLLLEKKKNNHRETKTN